VTLLARDMALALDPCALARRLGIEPDPWQAELFYSCQPEIALLCHRQAGKSTTTAILALHEANYRPPALVLLLAPGLRQSQELFKKVTDFHAELGEDATVAESETAVTLELANGSRIVCLPGNPATVRGYSKPRLVVIDEAARADDDLYAAVRPMLVVSGGRLLLLSTPWLRQGFFHDVWHRGGPDWQRIKVTADECPRISAEALAKERRQMTEADFRREYLCEFIESDGQLFKYETVMAALDDELEPWFESPETLLLHEVAI
jgi:hypothetical protein